jgi:hypothetical protein
LTRQSAADRIWLLLIEDACYPHLENPVPTSALRIMTMAVAGGASPARELSTRPASSAAKDIGRDATEHAAPAEERAAEAGSDMLLGISRMIYSGSYALAYGVVYAAVFIAQSLPQENPVMHGIRDGGRAAMDQLEEG